MVNANVGEEGGAPVSIASARCSANHAYRYSS